MPLIHGGSRADIATNIREMVSAGHPRRQAVAAALRTADQYGKSRAAGGSTGALQAPTYQTAAPSVNASGFVPVPQIGDYNMDLNTGALSPQTIKTLQSFAMRGLPPPGGYPQPAAPTMAQGPPKLDQSVIPGGVGGEGDTGAEGPGGGEDGAESAWRGGRPKRKLAQGGIPSSAEMAPWFAKSEAHAMEHPSGLVHGMGPGRTDTVPLSVASGSHVIPADVVAGLGQGNTLAGAHALGMAMKGGPGGIALPQGPHRSTIPRPPMSHGSHLAQGGEPQFEGNAIKLARGGVPESEGGVKCMVAGGEWIMSPDEVLVVKPHRGKRGHEGIDAWIMDRRGEDVRKLKKLPGPVK